MLERKPEIRAATPGQYVKQRIAQAAHTLSRKGVDAAHVELCNEALAAVITLVQQGVNN